MKNYELYTIELITTNNKSQIVVKLRQTIKSQNANC